ncbi:MAG: proton-conducting transporter membrane subunit [Anaerolineales bacterium]|nr:proton-conducting transporter membrane subunit [Anaerolineales bacterium]
MNAPQIWILIPMVFSLGLLPLIRWRKLVALLGSGFALSFAVVAWLLPIGKLLTIGIFDVEVQPSWSLFGRSFILENADRPFLIILYLGLGFWYIGTFSTRVHPLFVPLGMGIGVALTASVLIQPNFYGAILILIAAMMTVVLFTAEEQEVFLGVKRFWVFQSLAMPFLLLAGWMISGTEANPEAIPGATLIYILLLLGLSLLLGGAPFQSWLPAVAERVNLYSFSFVTFITSFFTLLYALTLLKQTPWLSSSGWIVIFFSFQGFLLTLFGGLGAVYHRHLGRWVGYALIKEIGLSFLLIGLGLISSNPNAFLGFFFVHVFPRGIVLALLAFACNLYIERKGSLQIQELAGLGRQFPFATIAFFVSVLTLVGFPLTAAFPIHLLIWQGWFVQFPPIAFAAIFGSVGVLIGGLRAMAVLVRSVDEAREGSLESRSQIILLTISTVALLLAGVFPQWFLPYLYRLGLTFMQSE